MIIIDNRLLIPTPLVLRHQNEPRWKVIQHLKKTHPFLPEELKPDHSSFPTLERDITTILKRLKLPATNFHSTLATWLIDNLTLFHYKKISLHTGLPTASPALLRMPFRSLTNWKDVCFFSLR
jgi:hypothetical protein